MAEPQAILAPGTDHPIGTASASGQQTLSLPRWESFPDSDRQQLVQTILQAAQRHLTRTAAPALPALRR
jgi:hypothetical protein